MGAQKHILKPITDMFTVYHPDNMERNTALRTLPLFHKLYS